MRIRRKRDKRERLHSHLPLHLPHSLLGRRLLPPKNAEGPTSKGSQEGAGVWNLRREARWEAEPRCVCCAVQVSAQEIPRNRSLISIPAVCSFQTPVYQVYIHAVSCVWFLNVPTAGRYRGGGAVEVLWSVCDSLQDCCRAFTARQIGVTHSRVLKLQLLLSALHTVTVWMIGLDVCMRPLIQGGQTPQNEATWLRWGNNHRNWCWAHVEGIGPQVQSRDVIQLWAGD